MWDDFDGNVEILEYETGDFNTQITGIVYPDDYEFQAREVDEPEEGSTDGLPRIYWSMGGDESTFQVSNDGMDAVGPSPTKQTRAAKGMTLLVSFADVKMTSKRLDIFNDADNPVGCHWELKDETSTNPETKQRVTRPVLYPAGSKVGEANYGKEKPAKGRSRKGRGKSEEKEEVTEEESPRRRRRASSDDAPAASSNGDASPRRRRGAASTEEALPPDENAQEVNGDEGQEAAIALLIRAVESKGEDGLTVRGINTALMAFEDDAGEEVVKEAIKRATRQAALEAGSIIEEDGKLFLPE